MDLFHGCTAPAPRPRFDAVRWPVTSGPSLGSQIVRRLAFVGGACSSIPAPRGMRENLDHLRQPCAGAYSGGTGVGSG